MKSFDRNLVFFAKFWVENENVSRILGAKMYEMCEKGCKELETNP